MHSHYICSIYNILACLQTEGELDFLEDNLVSLVCPIATISPLWTLGFKSKAPEQSHSAVGQISSHCTGEATTQRKETRFKTEGHVSFPALKIQKIDMCLQKMVLGHPILILSLYS